MQANALVPGWGQIIFQSANEIAANKVLRDRLEEIEAQTDKDKEWWEKRRTNIKSDFMKELEAESEQAQAKAGSEDEAVLVDTDTPSATPSGASNKGKK